MLNASNSSKPASQRQMHAITINYPYIHTERHLSNKHVILVHQCTKTKLHYTTAILHYTQSLHISLSVQCTRSQIGGRSHTVTIQHACPVVVPNMRQKRAKITIPEGAHKTQANWTQCTHDAILRLSLLRY